MRPCLHCLYLEDTNLYTPPKPEGRIDYNERTHPLTKPTNSRYHSRPAKKKMRMHLPTLRSLSPRRFSGRSRSSSDSSVSSSTSTSPTSTTAYPAANDFLSVPMEPRLQRQPSGHSLYGVFPATASVACIQNVECEEEGDELRLLEPRPAVRPVAGLFELMRGESSLDL